MLSSSTQQKLANLIVAIGEHEKRLEEMRIALINHQNFSLDMFFYFL